MAYEKQTFEDGEVLSASQLNHIEDGIISVENTIGEIESIADQIIAIQNGLIGGDGT